MIQPLLGEAMAGIEMLKVEIRIAGRQADVGDWFTSTVGEALVVHLAGELDIATAGELERQLRHAVERTGCGTVLINLARVHFIDAGSVGLILQASRRIRRRGGALWVEGLSGIPARVVDALGLRARLVRPGSGHNAVRAS